MASVASLAQAHTGSDEETLARAMTLSLAMSNLERSRPEIASSERPSGDQALREALEASLHDAHEDDTATKRAIELAMKESLKHDNGADLERRRGESPSTWRRIQGSTLGAAPQPDRDQGSCMELAIDLASAPTEGSGTFPPQSAAAGTSTDTTWEAATVLPDNLPRPALDPAVLPFQYEEEAEPFRSSAPTRLAMHPPSPPATVSEPSRGWVCVCAPDEMAHFFAREAFLVPAHLRAIAEMAHVGEPLFLLSRLDGLLRGGFEVKPGPQQGHGDGSVSVPFGVVREALVEFALPLGGSGLLEVLGDLTSQRCWELELWQVDAIEGKLEELAAQAHAGRTSGRADTSAGDEEMARALHVEMEREREREAKLESDRRAGVAAEEQRVAAARREAEAKAEAEAQEEAAARLEAEGERLRQAEERLRCEQEEDDARRGKQEEDDARRARELQAMEQAQLDFRAKERMAQELRDEQQARALHVAMRGHTSDQQRCAPCAPSAPPAPPAPSAPSAAVPMGLPVSPPSGSPARGGPASKLVIIDALNVGRSYNLGFVCPEHHNYRFDDPKRRCSVPACATAIAIAIEYFLKKGYRVEAFLPEWAFYGGKSKNMFAHEHTLLERFVDPHGKTHSILMTPAGADDDKFILQQAKNKIAEGEDVLVISNDMYRDHVASGMIDDAWMRKHAIKFSWLPRNGFFPMLT